MRRILNIAISTFCFCVFAGTALGTVRAGLGYATLAAGRKVPALELGLDIGDWSISGMASGVASKAYYSSGAMANALRHSDWGNFWFGRLEVGFGAGFYHGEKGIITNPDGGDVSSDIKKDQDNVFGPAFRVAFKPFSRMHVSVEYLMGVGTSIISNAWEDVGIGAIGVDL